jgi:hypothetical protein
MLDKSPDEAPLYYAGTGALAMQTPEHNPASAQTESVPAHELFEDISREMEEHRLRLEESRQNQHIHIYAIVNQGRLTDAQRAEFKRATAQLEVLPLITDPKYKPLQPYAAVLVCPPNADAPPEERLAAVKHLFKYNSDIISGWLTSRYSPEAMAAHLENATYAYKLDGSAYFLFYHNPATLPLLRRLATQEWANWFFDPVFSWRYPVDTPTEEIWASIKGYGLDMLANPPAPPRLVMSEELWEAMAGDPYPYTLLDFLNTQPGLAFNSTCFGVRLAQVEDLLAQAKKAGIQSQSDLATYVTALLQEPTRAQEPRWQAAVQAAAQNSAPLRQYYYE